MNLRARATDRAIAGGLALLAAALHAPLIFRTVGGCDEWHILTAGVRLAAGEVMYRDVTHIAGPGSFYLAGRRRVSAGGRSSGHGHRCGSSRAGHVRPAA